LTVQVRLHQFPAVPSGPKIAYLIRIAAPCRHFIAPNISILYLFRYCHDPILLSHGIGPCRHFTRAKLKRSSKEREILQSPVLQAQWLYLKNGPPIINLLSAKGDIIFKHINIVASLGENLSIIVNYTVHSHFRNLNWSYLPYIRPIFRTMEGYIPPKYNFI
jgi:hypothetical protein